MMNRSRLIFHIVLFAVHFLNVECNIFQTVFNFVIGEQEPERHMNGPEMIQHHGFPLEIHTVITKDGYVLELHRLPYGKNGPSRSRQPVIIQHGFLCSSAVWIWNIPEKNLPYLLVNEGYDVWLGNVRGNDYCRKHTTLDPDYADFWKFSWAEMAEFDMPSIIDYILRITGAEKIAYIGHSMGTSIAFAMLATKPEYNDKVKIAIALAPAAVLTHMRSFLRIFGPGIGMTILKLLKHGELPFSSFITDILKETLCRFSLTIPICTTAIYGFYGGDWSHTNQSRVGIYIHFIPSSTSVQVLEYMEQIIASQKFCMFAYKEDNQKVYNQSTPPEYDLSKVKTPVALFWGDNDWLTDLVDVATLPPKLPNVVLNHKINYTGFSHLDFLMANDVVQLVYDHVVGVIKEYAPCEQ